MPSDPCSPFRKRALLTEDQVIVLRYLLHLATDTYIELPDKDHRYSHEVFRNHIYYPLRDRRRQQEAEFASLLDADQPKIQRNGYTP